MPAETSLARAAHNIVTASLGLRPDQNLLIFADSDSLEAASVVAGTAMECGVTATILFIPYAFQAGFSSHESLPLPIEATIREADAVLSCLSPQPESLAYRRRVLRTSWSRRTKLAHAPGMTLDILQLVDTDFGLIHRRCQLVAAALALGQRLEVVTHDSQGHSFQLLADIAGWDCTPGISDGVIPNGAWDNLPPGETFIVPLSGDGQVAVNGSLPGLILAPGQELILTFRQGRLVEMQPAGSPAARHLQDSQIAHARFHGDSNWSNLAEIGFGANPAVREPTGIELVDEKMAGTVHIALGDSHSLGGRVESAIHCDLLLLRPTVRVDGKPLLAGGEWHEGPTDWLPDHRTVDVPPSWWAGIGDVRRSGVRAERVDDQLRRFWHSGPGRWDSVPVGVDPTARLAARLYHLLPALGERVPRAMLLERSSMDERTVAALLWVMQRYELVRVSRSG